MKVEVKVVCDVDWCDEDLGVPKEGDPLEERVQASIEEAIWNALQRDVNEGFVHDMTALVSILPDYCQARIVR